VLPFLPAMLSLVATLAAGYGASPAGKYVGEKSVLGRTIHMELTQKSATTVDVEMSGFWTVACPTEAYAYDGKSAISLPDMDKDGDCIHEALKGHPVTIGDITFDGTANTITVSAKFLALTISLVLDHSSSYGASASAPLSFAIVQPRVQTVTAAEKSAWFDAFEKHYAKSYATAEERAFRFDAFLANLDVVTARNADGNLGAHFVTKFADLTPEEFKARYLGYKPKPELLFAGEELEVNASEPEASVDWRGSKLVTPVKDQGQCGSCWAFSATEQIETNVALATGKLLSLSPQQITSCDKTDDGCGGGNTETAYDYVKKAGGIEASSSYPYSSGGGGRTGKCHSEKKEYVATIGGFKTVSHGKASEHKMVKQIKTSPISVCVDAEAWQTYTHGILGKSCGKQLDHCVQAVGYKTADAANGKPAYWIVRNSWNTDWGVDGFIYVEAGINACGIAKDATVVTGAALA